MPHQQWHVRLRTKSSSGSRVRRGITAPFDMLLGGSLWPCARFLCSILSVCVDAGWSACDLMSSQLFESGQDVPERPTCASQLKAGHGTSWLYRCTLESSEEQGAGVFGAAWGSTWARADARWSKRAFNQGEPCSTWLLRRPFQLHPD
jgi:hypothetical protein